MGFQSDVAHCLDKNVMYCGHNLLEVYRDRLCVRCSQRRSHEETKQRTEDH